MIIIELENCINWLKKYEFNKVSLQISDDYLTNSTEILSLLRKNLNISFFIVGNSVYEKCCSDVLSADHIEADACIHVGHSCLSCINDIPTFHIFPKQEIDVNAFCEIFSTYFEDKNIKILLCYDLSFSHIIDFIFKKLEPKYKNLMLSKLICDSNSSSQEQLENTLNFAIVGRSFNLSKNLDNYDGFFLGTNNRTLQTLALSKAVKKWYYYDNLRVLEFNALNFMWLKKRNFLIEKIKDAERFGLIIASLNIKEYLNIMEITKNILKKMSKKIYILSAGKINPSKLANFQEVDVFVIISCAENSLIDTQDYFKPVVTPFDIELAFNNTRTSFTPYSIDFKQMLPGGSNYKPFKNISQTDTSLLSGRVRHYPQKNLSENTFSDFKCKVHDSKKTINVFETRQWDGLDRKSDGNKVSSVEHGRSGIPVQYTNESLFQK